MTKELEELRKLAGLPVVEDCDEEAEENEDGECSPFTHADDNVDMVREDEECSECGGVGEVWGKACEVCGGEAALSEDDYEDDFEPATNICPACEGTGKEFGHGGGDDCEQCDGVGEVFEDQTREDLLLPPKDGKRDPWAGHDTADYANSVGDDDDRIEPELDRQTDYNAPPRDDGDDSYDMHEQGPGDDEDEFAADDDAMVDVGDDEDYEEFDFNDEFEQMMGNTNRFESIEINELRKRAGLPQVTEDEIPFDVGPEDDIVNNRRGKKIVTKAHVMAAGGVFKGNGDEYTGGPGTSTRKDSSDQVEIRVSKGFPNMKEWWKEDPKDIMSMVYWQKNQLPPSDPEKFAANWEKVKANLTKKFGAAPEVAESTDSQDETVPFEFNDEKAYYLVADEIGDRISFGMHDEILVPEQYVDGIIMILDTHGFEQGKDFSIAGMEEDLQNGYNDRESVDDEFDLRFPAGATSSPSSELGPAGAKHGDNPMRTPMASVHQDEDEIYESFKHAYRRFRK